MSRPTWERYALLIATAVATRSQDPYVKVGAVVMRADMSVASVGYNGAPAGIDIPWSDRASRRPLVIHAEVNALRYVTPGDGATLLATTHIPCSECLRVIASYGIKRVVYLDELEGYDTSDILAAARLLGLTVEYLEGS